jgi:hypothetical protein
MGENEPPLTTTTGEVSPIDSFMTVVTQLGVTRLVTFRVGAVSFGEKLH